MTTPAAGSAARQPHPGDVLYLDGLQYIVGEKTRKPDGEGKLHDVIESHRPDYHAQHLARQVRSAFKASPEYQELPLEEREAALDNMATVPSVEMSHKRNFNYKSGVTALAEHYVFLTAEQIAAHLAEQADALMSGSKSRRVWARSAMRAQLTGIPKDGAWVIVEYVDEEPHWRLLAKPTVAKVIDADGKAIEAPVLPELREEADALAVAVLSSADVDPILEQLTSWAPPQGTTLGRW